MPLNLSTAPLHSASIHRINTRTRALAVFFSCMALISLIQSGCVAGNSTIGRDFDTSKIASIRDGATTEGEIFNWFGLCSVKSIPTPDGEETWTYEYGETENSVAPGFFYPSFHTKGRTKTLTINLNKGIVMSHRLEEKTDAS